MRAIKHLLPTLILSMGLLIPSCTRTGSESEQPKLVSINIVDRNGISETISQDDRLQQYENVDFFNAQPYQKVLRIYGRDAQGNIRAYITSYHENGQIKQFLEVANNRAFGAYQEWYPNGTMKLSTTVIGGNADLSIAAEQSWLFDDCSMAWNEDGSVAAVIEYNKGELHGTSTYYHPNGVVWKRVPYVRNKIEGSFETYMDNGVILQTSHFSNGVRNGETTRWWNGESIAAQEEYCNGVLNSGQYYDIEGNLVSEITNGDGFRALFGKDYVSELHEFHQGSPEGEVKVYDRQGNLVRKYSIKEGLKSGEEVEYYDRKLKQDPQPKISINWYDGKIQGLVKTWYDNGQAESQREMTNNLKNGLLTAWYKDGSVMLIEEYDHDKLVKGKYFKKGEKKPLSEVTAGTGIATLFDSNGNFIRKINYYNGKPQE